LGSPRWYRTGGPGRSSISFNSPVTWAPRAATNEHDSRDCGSASCPCLSRRDDARGAVALDDERTCASCQWRSPGR
jgi:hypothetical protein